MELRRQLKDCSKTSEEGGCTDVILMLTTTTETLRAGEDGLNSYQNYISTYRQLRRRNPWNFIEG
jgi:hypothetical protein